MTERQKCRTRAAERSLADAAKIKFIERFWCTAKFYVRENFTFTLDGLRETIPESFKSLSPATINQFYNHCARTINAYINGYKYGTKAFIEQVYKSHRRIGDKTKW